MDSYRLFQVRREGDFLVATLPPGRPLDNAWNNELRADCERLALLAQVPVIVDARANEFVGAEFYPDMFGLQRALKERGLSLVVRVSAGAAEVAQITKLDQLMTIEGPLEV